MTASIIPHIDDLGVTLGSVTAMDELAGQGFVSSGSIMVPCPWFPAVVELAARRPELDLGIHLTLTAESAKVRWRPLSTTSAASGLLDADGYLWATVPELRAHADVGAVEEELRAQIQAALDAGIRLTHLDHHMGAAFAPEFVETTMAVAEEFDLPALVPADPTAYASVLNWGDADLTALEQVRDRVAVSGGLIVDHFMMGLTFMDEDPETVYRRFLDDATGVVFLSMHCNAPGEVDQVHPKDAHWRVAEYEWLAAGAPDLRGTTLTEFGALSEELA